MVKGSKEEQEAKEEPITQVNKETAQDMLNRFLKLQGTANELTGEVDTLLKKLGLPMKALKAKAEDIATKKNQKRAAQDAQASDNGGQQQQQAQPETASAPIDHVAGDNMMESAESYGLGAYAGLFMEAGEGIKCPNCGTMNPSGSKFCLSCGKPLPAPATKSEPPKKEQPPKQQQPKSNPPKDDKTQAQPGSTSGTKSEPPKQQQPNSNPPKDDKTQAQAGSTETKTEPPKNDQNQNGGNQQQAAPADNGNAQTEEKQESEFSKLPWYDKAITALQATLETMLALVAATGKSVLNIVAKVIQWDKIKAGANKLEQRVMDGRGNGKDDNANQSNEGNDQQQNADNGGNGNTGNGDANAENGSEAAHDDTVTGDYTTESPDLFGIHDEYNEMMESPSMEELNSFEAIFDNL